MRYCSHGGLPGGGGLWPDLEELLTIRRRKDVPGRRLSMAEAQQQKGCICSHREGSPCSRRGLVCTEGETLFWLDSCVRVAGPTGIFRPQNIQHFGSRTTERFPVHHQA